LKGVLPFPGGADGSGVHDPLNSASTLLRLWFDTASTLFESASSLKKAPVGGVESFPVTVPKAGTESVKDHGKSL
jgi:hypothetical protein